MAPAPSWPCPPTIAGITPLHASSACPIVEVVKGGDVSQAAYCDHDSGELVNSGFLDGMQPPEAIQAVTAWLSQRGLGEAEVQYKLRDWVFSRQRYWGEPIPIYFPVTMADENGDPRQGAEHTIHFDQPIAVAEEDLPLELPELSNFEPGDEPAGALARRHRLALLSTRREMVRPLRPTPCRNGQDRAGITSATPIRATTAAPGPNKPMRTGCRSTCTSAVPSTRCLHLLYARFWHKVMFDMGLVKDREPFQKAGASRA